MEASWKKQEKEIQSHQHLHVATDPHTAQAQERVRSSQQV
jgi:hypothetical protein